MKKGYLLLLFFTTFGFSQYNPSAPWMKDVKKANEKATIDEIKVAFDNYWSKPEHDKNIKGSGYKPFMRWEYFMRSRVNDKGEFITWEEINKALNQKKEAKNNTSNRTIQSSNWEPIGPLYNATPNTRALGRVNISAVDPNNPNIIYFGTPAGGIWKSIDSGANWTPLFDEYPQIGVSGIAIDYTNSNVIYITTGDKDASDSDFVGVYKSTDGGLSWNATGSISNASLAGDIIMHPTDNQMLYCATDAGLYRTANGGASWNRIITGTFHQGSIRVKPDASSVKTVYATSNNSFFKSVDDGLTFSQITIGLPPTSARMLLDITPANGNYVYILSSNTDRSFQGIYKSIDGGDSFIKTNETQNIFENTQSWYDLALAVSSTNENEIYTGCLNIWKSTNGGDAFTRVNQWNVANAKFTHADIHHLQFINNVLHCGSDGGLYISNNNAFTFSYITNGAQISQFYKISVAKQSANNVSGGLQDNGGYAFSSSTWKGYHSGDGMDSAIDPTNPNKYYGFSQYGGSLNISSDAGNSLSGGASPPTNGSGTAIQGNWVTPLLVNNSGEVYSGFNNLYKLVGGSWVRQNVGTLGSGNYELVTCDPSNDDIMYVSNGSTLYKSTDRGINFVNVYSASSTIRSIEVHSTISNTLYIVTSGTNGKVLQSIDGGSSFSDISFGLPNIGKNVIVHQGRNTDNPLYVGTILGVYYKDDTMSTWLPYDINLPNVSVTDLEINLEDSKLLAGTYGRGVWQTDIPIQVPPNDIKLVQIQDPSSTLNCNPSITPKIEINNNGSNAITTATFNYTIDATPYNFTWSGNLAPGGNTIVSLQTVNLSKGNHTLNVTTTTTNDAYPDNNQGNVVFRINDSGTVGVVNTFTDATDELISYNESDSGSQWIRGVRNGGLMDSGGNSIYTTNLTGNYPDNVKSYLVSQCYNLSNVTNPEISFSLKYDLELNWDVVYVEYTTDFGANWNVLGVRSLGWYNSDRTPQTTGSDCNNCPGAQWTGRSLTNTTYTYPLSTLNNETNVIFRIVFHSDEGVNEAGVNVDNFVVTGSVLSTDKFEISGISVYPNPSNGLFTISSGTLQLTAVTVYDVTGKNIASIKGSLVSNKETFVDLSAASKGVYFLKIDTENGTITKRIIKE